MNSIENNSSNKPLFRFIIIALYFIIITFCIIYFSMTSIRDIDTDADVNASSDLYKYIIGVFLGTISLLYLDLYDNTTSVLFLFKICIICALFTGCFLSFNELNNVLKESAEDGQSLVYSTSGIILGLTAVASVLNLLNIVRQIT